MITAEYARHILNYDPDTGLLTWKNSRKMKAGSLAGSKFKNGYHYVTIKNTKYLSHRVAWLMVHGSWPSNRIDHVNGKSDDNRLSNLRAATASQNSANSKRPITNSSGFKGVHFEVRRQKWRAQYVLGGRMKWIGYFPTKLAAAEAYLSAATKAFGEFANNGNRSVS